VPDPALPAGSVRACGFGEVDGLRWWLQEERIDAVIDATHPFVARITAHTAKACSKLGLRHLVLAPAWDPGEAVTSDAEAAEVVCPATLFADVSDYRMVGRQRFRRRRAIGRCGR